MSFSIEELLKNSPLGKGPNEAQKKKIFFLSFCLILYQNAYHFVQRCLILCFKSIQKYTFGPTQIYL